MGLVLLPKAISYQSIGLPGEPGAGLWPTASLLGLIITSAIFSYEKIKEQEGKKSDFDFSSIKKEKNLLITVGLVILYWLIIPFLGFLFASIPFLFFAIEGYGYGRPKISALVAIVISPTLTILLGRILLLSLPKGIGIFNKLTEMFLWELF